MSAPAAEASSAPHPSRARQTTQLLVVLLLMFAPVLVVAASPWSQAASLLFLGLPPALLGFLTGPRFAWWGALITAAAFAAGMLLSPWPLAGAALVAVLSLGVAACAPGGRAAAAASAVVPVTLALVAPPTLEAVAPDAGLALRTTAATAFVLVGGLWVAAVATGLLRSVPLPPVQREDPADARVFAALLCPLTAAATFVAMRWFPGSHAWWLPATILLVLHPTGEATRRRAVGRTVGTVVGGAIAAIVVILVPEPRLLVLLGALLALAAAVASTSGPYTRYAALLTLAVILMTGDAGTALATDATRIVTTVVGAGVVLLVVGAGRWVLDRRTLTRRRPPAPLPPAAEPPRDPPPGRP